MIFPILISRKSIKKWPFFVSQMLLKPISSCRAHQDLSNDTWIVSNGCGMRKLWLLEVLAKQWNWRHGWHIATPGSAMWQHQGVPRGNCKRFHMVVRCWHGLMTQHDDQEDDDVAVMWTTEMAMMWHWLVKYWCGTVSQ